MTTPAPCPHPRLRVEDHDERGHWVLRCPDCAASLSLSERDWRARRRGLRGAAGGLVGDRLVDLVAVLDEGPESARLRAVSAAPCAHPRLRARDYDEAYHWLVSCPDCGHRAALSQAEWRARRPRRPSPQVVALTDQGD